MEPRDKKFTLVDIAIRIPEIDFSFPYRFYFRSEKLDARLERFLDEIIVARLFVMRDYFFAALTCFIIRDIFRRPFL